MRGCGEGTGQSLLCGGAPGRSPNPDSKDEAASSVRRCFLKFHRLLEGTRGDEAAAEDGWVVLAHSHHRSRSWDSQVY